jgi:cysteine desulfurase/selenocysteine lyase
LPLNIDQYRKDTPGCELVLHFNNAGASLPVSSVTDSIKNHLDLEATMGGYEAADFAEDKINQFYTSAARLIHCKPEEIAFMENATRAWDMAFYSLNLKQGDKILTTSSEYVSNYLAFLNQVKKTGVVIELVANDAFGQIDVADLENKIDKSVKLISLTHVPTNGGLVNPAQKVGAIAKKYGVTYLLDATQSIGQMPIDVATIGCDFLCATGRKYLRGPRGTGFLFASNSIVDQCNPPFIELQSAEWVSNNQYKLRPSAKRFETWEHSMACKIGLGVAIDYALSLDSLLVWDRIQYLAQLLRSKINSIPNLKLHDLGVNLCGIVTFSCSSKSAIEIQKLLSANKINTSVSLREYSRLDMSARNLSSMVRASIHYYNTEDEIDIFCKQLALVCPY